MTTLNEKTALFGKLHGPGKCLVLPNAWDAASARLVEDCGASAIATSSAALSWAHGFADGENIPPATQLAAVREIARVIELPLSVDAEAGLDAAPETVADFVVKLIEAGTSGINLEDGRNPPDLLAAKIRAIRRTAQRKGLSVFINARADTYLRKLAAPEALLEETIRRGQTYEAAGADGFFVPGLVDDAQIRAIAAAVHLPLNVLTAPGLAPIATLKSAGVRRVSAGSGPARAAFGVLKAVAHQMLDEGRFDAMFKAADDLPNLNTLLQRQTD
ncbi:MAG TPA: isocitrate lyase/phosphoenolpyruvate mutase family protein [Rhizomicrobium sp.]|nr:isocitrate lyase/phosphoenolpyruvate mutase family protein [Rhizomicrobium sp.]